ncbi:SpoIIE family protein phosphatase [Noviherbaspirillum malthae]|uniref:SpoIIE family protein phosphatase n=1 Tax=Noviherbaspirillum malthae TaxID=1260987 RepID=UPI00188DD493|nr:SpoIIE family protein phosphatase [Noviherbaspirillum malthae]
MIAAPIPHDDAQRVENLDSYLLLDTPFEAVFDEIASLAAKICGVPYALISLVAKDRQWFKAAHGLKDMRETPRDISFCGHAILQDDILHVPDTLEDARFSDNPFVTGELSIRVYAGMPLTSEEGYKLGTLCVLSDQPARLSDLQLESLKQLTAVLSALLKARKREARLALLGQVLNQLDDEVMLVDARSMECMYANSAACAAHGCADNSLNGRRLADVVQADADAGRLIEMLHTGRRDKVLLEQLRGAPGSEQRNVELRMQRLTQNGLQVIVAIGHDVSEQKRLEQARADLHDNLEKRNQELSRAYAKLSEEMAIAREMQQRFLPGPKCIDTVRFDWLFRASSYLGGDIFDYFPLGERHLCFYVIDVSGHGLSAALLAFYAQRQMYSARAEMLHLLHEKQGDIGEAASRLVQGFNERFASMTESGLYLTMVYGILDRDSGEVALVQAGHPPALLCKPGSAVVEPIGDGGLPIGILDHAEFESHRLRLTPGMRLYLYSDGVPDCANREDEAFGQERMERVLAQTCGRPLPEVREAIDQALTDWHGGDDGYKDDVTFLSLEFGANRQLRLSTGLPN